MRGRVAEDRRTQYIVSLDPEGRWPEIVGECSTEVLRDYRRGKGPRPVVGDWVIVEAARTAEDEERESSVQAPWRIIEVLNRRGYFQRRRPHPPFGKILHIFSICSLS